MYIVSKFTTRNVLVQRRRGQGQGWQRQRGQKLR